MTFGPVLLDDAEELDFVGPSEVFTVSAMVAALEGRAGRDGSDDPPSRTSW